MIKSSTTKLIQEINREHKAARANLDAYREHARKCGAALIKAKLEVKRGEWLPWLKENCPDLSDRTARGYMAFARDEDEEVTLREARGVKSATVADFRQQPDEPDEPDESEDGVNDALSNEEEELTEEQQVAVQMALDGESYRNIAKKVGVDESTVRRDPKVRAARMEADPKAHSTFNGGSAYCRVETAPELIRKINIDIQRLLFSGKYTLNKSDSQRMKRILKGGLEKLNGS